MDFKNWGGMLRKVFGAGSAPAVTPPSPEAQDAQQQLAGGTHRQYSPAEIRELTGYLLQIKDVTQTNMLAMSRLMQAAPKAQYKNDAAALCRALSGLGGAPWENTIDALGNCALFAAQLEEIEKRRAKSAQPKAPQDHLPVIDCERALVIGIAKMAQGACAIRRALIKQVAEAQVFLEIPELERIKRECAAYDDKVVPLLSDLTRMTLETLGRPGAGNAPKP